MDQQDQDLVYIKKVVASFLEDADIKLFGSRARNEAGPESDYDILVIIKNTITSKEKFHLKTGIRKALLKHGIRSDVLIQSETDIEKKRKLPGHIIRSILKEAIEI